MNKIVFVSSKGAVVAVIYNSIEDPQKAIAVASMHVCNKFSRVKLTRA
jgi:hypothetical protein